MHRRFDALSNSVRIPINVIYMTRGRPCGPSNRPIARKVTAFRCWWRALSDVGGACLQIPMARLLQHKKRSEKQRPCNKGRREAEIARQSSSLNSQDSKTSYAGFISVKQLRAALKSSNLQNVPRLARVERWRAQHCGRLSRLPLCLKKFMGGHDHVGPLLSGKHTNSPRQALSRAPKLLRPNMATFGPQESTESVRGRQAGPGPVEETQTV